MHITFGKYDIRMRRINDQEQLFDVVRSLWVNRTPEEWIRQYWIHHFIENVKFPRTRMKVETGLELNGLRKRCDLVLFSSQGDPLMIVEFKAPYIKFTKKTTGQISGYNLRLKVPYLLISNGSEHRCWRIHFAPEYAEELDQLPDLHV